MLFHVVGKLKQEAPLSAGGLFHARCQGTIAFAPPTGRRG